METKGKIPLVILIYYFKNITASLTLHKSLKGTRLPPPNLGLFLHLNVFCVCMYLTCD